MQIRLAAILHNSLVNGPGLRKVIFSQGCNHHCKECFNQHTWDFNKGVLKDCDEIINETLQETYLAGVTFSGGDPFQQPKPFAYIAKKLQKKNINIWSYTGYTFDGLLELSKTDTDIKELLENIDVLVDGRFILDQKDTTLLYRGSKNQRLIDVKKSLKTNDIILWNNQAK